MENRSVNTKLEQSETAKELSCSSSTLKRYRNDINMISPYRNPSNINKRKQKISNIEPEPRRNQLSSNDLKQTQMSKFVEPIKPVKTKNKLKGGAIIENNDKYLDEILHNINL